MKNTQNHTFFVFFFAAAVLIPQLQLLFILSYLYYHLIQGFDTAVVQCSYCADACYPFGCWFSWCGQLLIHCVGQPLPVSSGPRYFKRYANRV